MNVPRGGSLSIEVHEISALVAVQLAVIFTTLAKNFVLLPETTLNIRAFQALF